MAGVTRAPRFVLMLAAMAMLLLALAAGLVRLGWNLAWLPPVVTLAHGPLMICGFLGTLICLERAVALGTWWSYLAPALAAAGSIAVLTGTATRAGLILLLLAGAALIRIFAYVFSRQPTLFTATMGIGAVAWFTGMVLWLRGAEIPQFVHWWVAFLVLTIVGERLELNRLRPPTPYTKHFFVFGLAIYLAGLIWASALPAHGGALAGAGMFLLALWLALFDVARYTIRQNGLPRFIAVCLIAGYAWLGIGGLLVALRGPLGAAGCQPYFLYDAELHSVLLGFVFSMIFAHAPIVFPAVTGRAMAFRTWLYVHVVVLHAALAARIAADLAGSYAGFRHGGLCTVVADVLFIVDSIAAIAIACRERHASQQRLQNAPGRV